MAGCSPSNLQMDPLRTKGRSPFWNRFLKETDTGLDGDDRINEVIFGLIMVLTFTCTLSASAAGKAAIDKMFWSALGCNIAWGIVDGCLYLFSMLYQRGESIDTINRPLSSERIHFVIRWSSPLGLLSSLRRSHL